MEAKYIYSIHIYMYTCNEHRINKRELEKIYIKKIINASLGEPRGLQSGKFAVNGSTSYPSPGIVI